MCRLVFRKNNKGMACEEPLEQVEKRSYYYELVVISTVLSCAAVTPTVQDVALFKEGFPANDAIKLMAEDGDNSALLVRSLVCFLFPLGRIFRCRLLFYQQYEHHSSIRLLVCVGMPRISLQSATFSISVLLYQQSYLVITCTADRESSSDDSPYSSSTSFRTSAASVKFTILLY